MPWPKFIRSSSNYKLETATFPQTPGSPPPPQNFGRAQHQVQHSHQCPASGPAVYLFSIRPLMLSPSRAQQPHVRLSKKPARRDFGTFTGPMGSNFTSLLQTQAWKSKVDKKAYQSKRINKRSTVRRRTWPYLLPVRSYWQKMT